MNNKNGLSQEELRKKLDGFKIETEIHNDTDTYKTIDKGVYMPPDDHFDSAKKEKN